MIKIKTVGVVAGEGEGLLGTALDVHLSNGQTILLSLRVVAEDPRFAEMYRDGRLFVPRTDGARVYWDQGPSLTLEEIMTLVEG